MKSFQSYLERSKSPHTAKLYGRAVRDFLTWVDKPIDEITTLDICAWQDHLLESMSPRSADAMSAALKTFFRTIGRYDLAMAVPSVRYEAKPIGWLPEETVNKIIEAGEKPLHQAVLAAGYELALRVSEVILLERGWFSYEARQCKVRRLKRKGAIPVYDFLPMRDYYAEKLQTYLESRDDDHPAMFVSRGKFGRGRLRPLSKQGVEYIYHRAAKRAGIDPLKVTWHSYARHSRISNYTIQMMRETGSADLVRIMKLAGHVSEKSTLVYLHIAAEHLLRTGRGKTG